MKCVFQKSKPGFALPLVTIAIAALSLLLVGLLTILSLERKTARSYSDQTRAELALNSGFAVATTQLTEISQRDDGLVFRIDDPTQPQVQSSERPLGYREQFFTYAALFKSGEWRGIPLFSVKPEMIDLGNSHINTAPLVYKLKTFTDDPNTTTLVELSEYDQNIPRAQWVDVRSPDPSAYDLRYAYWIEDLGGRIGAKHAASKKRSEGESTEEINYATILDPSSDTTTLPAALIASRNKLRSSGSLRQILSADKAKRLEPYIHYYGSAPAPPTPTLIPHGFSYADAGLPAPDLNEFVTNQNVEGIATHITRQIPSFDNRKGGFPSTEDYVKTIAASIIDYADADSDTTSGPGYRGIDSYPFVNEIADRYEWLASSPEGEVWIHVETYIELWNPSQQGIKGEIEFTNINHNKIQKRNGKKVIIERSFSNFQSTQLNISLQPNGFSVKKICEKTFKFSGFPTVKGEKIFFPDDSGNSPDSTSQNNFALKWNGKLIDRARGGRQSTMSGLEKGFSRREWKCNASPVHHWGKGQWGDPRSSWYINAKLFGHTYEDNSSWGGRSLKRTITEANTKEVLLNKWPDRGSNSAPGIDPGSQTRIPTDTRIINKLTGVPWPGKTYPPNEPEKAPAFISNAGRYTSLGELGHIFDPAQWSKVESSGGKKDEKSGGGITLAIGRPEYAPFDYSGLQAAQLLDIFSLTSSNPISAKININTAPREVLRTLVADVILDDDPVATSVKLKKQAAVGDYFADHVIAQRNCHPLRSLSDLNNLRMNPIETRDHSNPAHTPFFGNSAYFENATAIGTDEWDDAGREELFRKVMNLVTFRSKMFRIVVAGEARSKKGQVLARSTREFHISIKPQRDANGIIIPGSKPRIIKHFEKVR